MKKYKVYCDKLQDTIMAATWRIDSDNGCHIFRNENDEIICTWPIHNSIVEVCEHYDKMKDQLRDQMFNKESNSSTSDNAINKINHNVGDLS